jgi:alkanesulfonate monooxygenase SsuD/methylene tetrahydromethanopterin reductase-like flavin-dependent oxidoreductase (luciferase family)
VARIRVPCAGRGVERRVKYQDATGRLHLGLFDILQVDQVVDIDISRMYQRRLDDLALADSLGFDVAFCAERHFLPTHAAASATAWIAAASQRTSRMRLGVMGYTLPIRHPVQLAEDVAVLDLLTQGRLEIGFGIGHRVEELIALGVDPARRIPAFQERLAVLQALWTGGQVSFERGDLKLQGLSIAPLPVQSPHPPLWYAGTEPVAARWMGEQGLGLAVGFRPAADLKPAVDAFMAGRQARSETNREAEPARPAGTVAMMRAVVVGESDEAAKRAVVEELVRFRSQAVAEGSRSDRYREAETYFDELLAGEVMISGGPDTVAQAILDLKASLGIDLFLANVYPMGADPDRVRETLHLLAGPVRQHIAAT